jgi:hypothetical protein
MTKSKGKRQISKGKRSALSLFLLKKAAQPAVSTFAFCLLPFAF